MKQWGWAETLAWWLICIGGGMFLGWVLTLLFNFMRLVVGWLL